MTVTVAVTVLRRCLRAALVVTLGITAWLLVAPIGPAGAAMTSGSKTGQWSTGPAPETPPAPVTSTTQPPSQLPPKQLSPTQLSPSVLPHTLGDARACATPAPYPFQACSYLHTQNTAGPSSFPAGNYNNSATPDPFPPHSFCGNFNLAVAGSSTTYTEGSPTNAPALGFVVSTNELTTNPVQAAAAQLEVWNLLGQDPGSVDNPGTFASSINAEVSTINTASGGAGPYSATASISSSGTSATFTIVDGSGHYYTGGGPVTVAVTSASGTVTSTTYNSTPTSGTFSVSIPAGTQQVSADYTFLPSTSVVYWAPSTTNQGFYTAGPLNTASATVVPHKLNGTISIYKQGNDMAYYSIAGAVFDVRGPIGEPGVASATYSLTTNAQGYSLPTPPLRFGNYDVTEVSSPPNYNTAPAQLVAVTQQRNYLVSYTGSEQDTIHQSQITIEKLDAQSGAPLAGAVFDVRYDQFNNGQYNENLGQCTTSSTGSCMPAGNYPQAGTNLLLPGWYQITEISAPPGYYLDPTTAVDDVYAAPFTLVKAKFNDYLLGSLRVRKTGNDTAYHSIAGAVFKATGPAPSTASAGTLTVAPDGVSNTLTGLKAGTYTVSETTAPSGYGLAPPQSVDVTYGATTASVSFADAVVPAALSVRKVSSTTGSPLAGAVFDTRYDPSGTGHYTVDLGRCTTDATGSCTPPQNDTGGYLPGNYQITEVTAPQGFYLDPFGATQDVTLNPGETGTASVVSFSDLPLVPASFQKVATGNYNPAQVSYKGAVITLYDRGSSGSPTGPQVTTCTTDTSGACSTSSVLVPGNGYCWVETAAPPGLAGGARGCFIASSSQAGLPITVTDAGEFVEISANKVDAADPSVKLPGAVFDLYRVDGGHGPGVIPTPPSDATAVPGDTWVARATTGASGVALFPLQYPGFSYCVIEHSAPQNFKVNPVPSCTPVLNGSTSPTPAPTQVTVADTSSTITINAHKFNSLDPNTSIPGATYDLFVQGSPPPGATPQPAPTSPPPASEPGDSWYERGTTNSNGDLSFSVPSGYAWCMKEVAAPINYSLDPALHCTAVLTTSSPPEATTIALPETLANLTLSAHKFNSLDPNTSIPGATYELVVEGSAPPGTPPSAPADANVPPGDSYWATGTSNASGNLVFTVPSGYSWCLHELNAPSGYQPDPSFHCTGVLTTASPASALSIALPELPVVSVPSAHTGEFWAGSGTVPVEIATTLLGGILASWLLMRRRRLRLLPDA